MIQAGELRHSVRIEQRTTAQDSSGDPLPVWTLFAKRRAAVGRVPGKEVFSSTSAARVATVPAVWRLRYLPGVTPAMRLVHGQRVFNIISAIDPDGLKNELFINAEELIGKTP